MKPFTRIAAVVFSVVAILHLLRLSSHWQVVVNGIIIPQWFSILGFFVAAVLAFMLWKEAKK
jgi:hypothetical protein